MGQSTQAYQSARAHPTAHSHCLYLRCGHAVVPCETPREARSQDRYEWLPDSTASTRNSGVWYA